MKKIKYYFIGFLCMMCFNVNAEVVNNCSTNSNGAVSNCASAPATHTNDICNIGEKKINTNFGEIINVNSFKETTNENDQYDTIERNSTLIGSTKFTPDQVITASKAAKAGANDVLLYSNSRVDDLSNYKFPEIYIYYGEIGGWYKLDTDNNPIYIEDSNEINNLSDQNIYFVNNKIKGIYIGNFDFHSDDCLNSNLVFDKKEDLSDGNVNGDIFITSYSNIINIDNFSLSNDDLFFRFDESNGEYNVIPVDNLKEIEIVDVEGSTINQKRIFIKLHDNSYGDGIIKITYTNGNTELVYVEPEGYLVPNINAIEKVEIV